MRKALALVLLCPLWAHANLITYGFGGTEGGFCGVTDDRTPCTKSIFGYLTIDDTPIPTGASFDSARYETNGPGQGMLISVGGLVDIWSVRITAVNDNANSVFAHPIEDLFVLTAQGAHGSMRFIFEDGQGDAIDSAQNLAAIFADLPNFQSPCFDSDGCIMDTTPGRLGVDPPDFIGLGNYTFDWRFFRSPVVIPVPMAVLEPSTVSLLALGLLLLAWRRSTESGTRRPPDTSALPS